MTKRPKAKIAQKAKPEEIICLPDLKPLFNASHLKTIQKGLLEKRNQLTRVIEEKRVRELEATMATANQGDDADVANQTYEKEMIFEISSNERETIKQIDEALRKITAKTYGYCSQCRKPIPKKRLFVIPHSRYCLACQAVYETRV